MLGCPTGRSQLPEVAAHMNSVKLANAASTTPQSSIELGTSTPPPERAFALLAMSLLWVFILPAVGTLGAIVTVVRGQVMPIHVLLLVAGFVSTGLGVTIGYHRLLTHRSF